MGWYYTNNATRSDVIDELTEDRSKDGRVLRTLRKCFRGNTMYALHESGPVGETKKWIGVYLLQRSDCGWGHKPMDESMGPYECDCPVSYIDEADEPANEYAAKWREECRKRAAKKAAQSAKRPKVGEIWTCHGASCKRIRIAKVEGRRIEAYNLSPGGGYFRIPKKLLGERVDDTLEAEAPTPGHLQA